MARKAIIQSGNWSDSGIWENGELPTAEDDVIVGAVYGDVILDVSAVCKTINVQNFVGNFIFNENTTLVITDKVYFPVCSGFFLVNPVGKLYCSNPAVYAYFDTEKKVVVYNDGLADFIVSYI